MSNEQKRTYVSNLYNGPRWKRRVAKMSIDQIISIYLKHQRDGSLPHHEEEATSPQGLLDISIAPQKSGSHPHANEDQFPII